MKLTCGRTCYFMEIINKTEAHSKTCLKDTDEYEYESIPSLRWVDSSLYGMKQAHSERMGCSLISGGFGLPITPLAHPIFYLPSSSFIWNTLWHERWRDDFQEKACLYMTTHQISRQQMRFLNPALFAHCLSEFCFTYTEVSVILSRYKCQTCVTWYDHEMKRWLVDYNIVYFSVWCSFLWFIHPEGESEDWDDKSSQQCPAMSAILHLKHNKTNI